MSKYELFTQVRNAARRSDASVSNLSVLGLDSGTRSLHILWMYPDVLCMHGGRGDAMALLHFSNLMGLPCELMRINELSGEIPFDWADMIFFQSGDLCCMADVSRALLPHEEEFRAFREAGKTILAIGSSGAILARRTLYRDGSEAPGLGLLDMEFHQREKVHGDDLWITADRGGYEIVASQIQTADVTLLSGQEAFGTVKYGRGNCGDGKEGARTGNVIFTHCLGPALTKNPALTEDLLRTAADTAGVRHGPLKDEDVALETQALEDVRSFIERKMRGEVHF